MHKIGRIINNADGTAWTLGKGSVTIRREESPGWQGFIANTHNGNPFHNETEHANAVFISTYDPEHATLIENALEALEDAVRIHFPNFLKAEEELIEYRIAHGLWGKED